MNRWILGIAAVGLVAVGECANAQYYAYGAPAGAVYIPGAVYQAPVYPAPVYFDAAPVVTSAYYAPPAYAPAYLAPQPVVQMGYSVPVVVSSRAVFGPAVVAAPVLAAPGYVRQTTRVSPHNYTQTVRAYGPTAGPHYSRVHVHSGLFGTTVRERVR